MCYFNLNATDSAARSEEQKRLYFRFYIMFDQGLSGSGAEIE